MKTNNAELKLVKVGEACTDQTDGNPESSTQLSEEVETGRRVCIRCNKDLIGQQKKFCSMRCTGYWHRLQKGEFKKPGVGSGNGEEPGFNHHSYKNGIRNFSERAFAHYGKKCNRCGTLDKLLVHHKDHNRGNNEIDNLEVLCKRCHQMHHCKRDPKTGKYIKGQSEPR